MNIRAPKIPFTDRVVICGDAGSTRLFKDGIGAAYIMGKAAAKTAVFQGVGREHFQKWYYPVYKSIIHDNHFGKYLFTITDIYKKNKILCKGMLEVVRKEQSDLHNHKILSSILWDMFTGSERYKNIFCKAVSLAMHLDLWEEFAKIFIRRER
jgi:flavin-dependent dehydrogenase